MGGRKVEAVATKTTTERGPLTALQAARQTKLDRDGLKISEPDPGRGE